MVVNIFNQQNFFHLPGYALAYWASKEMIDSFKNGRALETCGKTCQGMSTADNNKYLRFWFEVFKSNIEFECSNEENAKLSKKIWYPINKGGEFRRWYGNQEYVVNYFCNGMELKSNPNAYVRNSAYYFKEFLTWSKISSGAPSFRWFGKGFTFADAGMSFCSKNEEQLKFYLGLLNSVICTAQLAILSPTMNYEAGQINKISIFSNIANKEKVEKIVEQSIEISRDDWDSFETSWDFKKHPLI